MEDIESIDADLPNPPSFPEEGDLARGVDLANAARGGARSSADEAADGWS